MLEYLNEGQALLRQNEDIIPDIEKQIIEAEMIKNHVRKLYMYSSIKRVKHVFVYFRIWKCW